MFLHFVRVSSGLSTILLYCTIHEVHGIVARETILLIGLDICCCEKGIENIMFSADRILVFLECETKVRLTLH